MIHDFLITEKYAILPDCPLIFKPELIVEKKFPFQMDRNVPSVYIVLDRETGEVIHKFTLPSHYVFHYFNAWNEKVGNEEQIIIYACKYDFISLGSTNFKEKNLEGRKDLDPYDLASEGEHPFKDGQMRNILNQPLPQK